MSQTCWEVVNRAVPARFWSFPSLLVLDSSIPRGAAGFLPLLPPASLGPKQEGGVVREPQRPPVSQYTGLLSFLSYGPKHISSYLLRTLNVTHDQKTPAKTCSSGEHGHQCCSAGPLSCLKVDALSLSLYLCEKVMRGKNKVQLPAYLGISLNKYK